MLSPFYLQRISKTIPFQSLASQRYISSWFKNLFGGNSETVNTSSSVPTVASKSVPSSSSESPFQKSSPGGSSAIAKQRLRLILSQSRSEHGRLLLSSDQFEQLQQDLLKVVNRYIHVNSNAASLSVREHGGLEIFEMSVPLEDEIEQAVSAFKSKAPPKKAPKKAATKKSKK